MFALFVAYWWGNQDTAIWGHTVKVGVIAFQSVQGLKSIELVRNERNGQNRCSPLTQGRSCCVGCLFGVRLPAACNTPAVTGGSNSKLCVRKYGLQFAQSRLIPLWGVDFGRVSEETNHSVLQAVVSCTRRRVGFHRRSWTDWRRTAQLPRRAPSVPATDSKCAAQFLFGW